MGIQQARDAVAAQGGGATIESPAERGLTLKQLRQLHAHLLAESPDPADEDARRATFHRIAERLIRPATEARGCSLAELVSGAARPPAWVVIHRFDETLDDVMLCLERHAADRGLPDGTVYWVRAERGRRSPPRGGALSMPGPRACGIPARSRTVLGLRGAAARGHDRLGR